MKLNTIKPADGSKKDARRVGRGNGSGFGKTAGRGIKGQKSRAGGFHKVGFEGGQMPLQQRLPKFGFSSRVNNLSTDINLRMLDGMKEVSLEILKEKKLVNKKINKVKIYGDHKLSKALNVNGLSVTKGALKSIEESGGKVS